MQLFTGLAPSSVTRCLRCLKTGCQKYGYNQKKMAYVCQDWIDPDTLKELYNCAGKQCRKARNKRWFDVHCFRKCHLRTI